jgi:hypothetical protein
MIYFLKLAAEIAEIRLRLQGDDFKICKKILVSYVFNEL